MLGTPSQPTARIASSAAAGSPIGLEIINNTVALGPTTISGGVAPDQQVVLNLAAASADQFALAAFPTNTSETPNVAIGATGLYAAAVQADSLGAWGAAAAGGRGCCAYRHGAATAGRACCELRRLVPTAGPQRPPPCPALPCPRPVPAAAGNLTTSGPAQCEWRSSRKRWVQARGVCARQRRCRHCRRRCRQRAAPTSVAAPRRLECSAVGGDVTVGSSTAGDRTSLTVTGKVAASQVAVNSTGTAGPALEVVGSANVSDTLGERLGAGGPDPGRGHARQQAPALGCGRRTLPPPPPVRVLVPRSRQQAAGHRPGCERVGRGV